MNSQKFYAKCTENTLKLLSEKEELLVELPIVKATAEHRNFIISTWVHSYREHANKRMSLHGMPVRSEDYLAGESKLAEQHWDKAKVVTGEDGYTIHAWICCESGSSSAVRQSRLWHIYVQPALRGSGVARSLIDTFLNNKYCTHKPWPDRIPRNHKVTYNPWINT